MKKRKVIIMGAGGRDFHNFSMVFRDNSQYKVVAFTAAQIPGIANRIYPKGLAGKLYPQGIKIYPEEKLVMLIRKFGVDEVVLAYSDLSHAEVMEKASVVLAAGADFTLLGPKSTMLKSKTPVISVCAVRTGCGKSMTTQKIAQILRKAGKNVVVVRHPMVYGEFLRQGCERFESVDDLVRCKVTVEEREDLEPSIEMGAVVYEGVDYYRILKKAEKEAQIIIWDGGNNDLPFLEPDLHIVLTDPHRAGHELTYYPGEANLRMADVVIVNKVNTAKPNDVKKVINDVKKINPKATIIKANSVIEVDDPKIIRNKKVLVVEDGPTLTHGGMSYGAGFIAAQRNNCKIVDPRPYTVGSIKKTFQAYPHLEKVLPALGYSAKQIRELERTINRVKCDAVIIATPANLARFMHIRKPTVRVSYKLQEIGKPDLMDVLARKGYIKRRSK